MNTVDLRSDTVTQPTPAMREAMMAAPLGDDVFGDDPSVNALQEKIAALTGKEAALFMSSGTQSNLCGMMAHCGRGDEYIVGQNAHTYRYEGGGAAVLGSIQPQPLAQDPQGLMNPADVRAAIKPDDPHFARTRLLCLENTWNGHPMPAAYLDEMAELARDHGLALHLDGARVFNAAVASGKPLADMCQPFDSVSICFSKGLGAPVGSVLVGSAELIARAHRWRKMLGGGLRQAGVLAAACLYALEHNVDRLAEDHANARLLAEGLGGIAGVTVLSQDTNMVFVQVEPALCDGLTAALDAQNIKMRAVYGGPTRLVTHLDISADDVRRAVRAVADYCSTRSALNAAVARGAGFQAAPRAGRRQGRDRNASCSVEKSRSI